MNKRILELYKEATGKDWAYDFDPQVAEKFAELIYQDIITVVAAQALSNRSALDVFKNLKRIYEGVKE